MKHVLQFAKEKETKGAVQYKELDENGRPQPDMYSSVIGSVYIRKDKLNGIIPERITVTVESA